MTEAPAPSGTPGRSDHILLVASAIVFFFYAAFHVSPFWALSPLIWFMGAMAALAVLAFINAALVSGWRHAAVFLALAACIGFAAEQVGIWTGLIFGPYDYTDKLGPKLIDVPLVIPLCWFAVVYFAHTLVNIIVMGTPTCGRLSLAQVSLLALVTAFVATGFDVAIDPMMSHPDINAWNWTQGGAYFGVPFRNFQGWVATVFVIDLVFRLFARRNPRRPSLHQENWAARWAIAAWAGLGFGVMIIGFPVETQLVAVFCLFLPALLAMARQWTGDLAIGKGA